MIRQIISYVITKEKKTYDGCIIKAERSQQQSIDFNILVRKF